MSKDDDETQKRPYEAGRGKPPKQHQLKPKGHDAGGTSKRKPRTKRRASDKEQVDLALLFAQPVMVTKGERREKMPTYEASLRKQVERAIKERSLPAIKAVLDEAITWDLLKKPAPAPGGGVLQVPLRTAEDLERYNSTFFPAEDLACAKSEDDDE